MGGGDYADAVVVAMDGTSDPGMDGPETLRRIRQMGVKVPVVMITGYGELDALESLPGGSLPILYKPFRAEALLRTIGRAMRGRTASGTFRTFA